VDEQRNPVGLLLVPWLPPVELADPFDRPMTAVGAFLSRVGGGKDRAEFDRFMADRAGRSRART
jgi:hypothetical protein